METSTVTRERYTYVHDFSKGLPEAIDIHHITIRRSRAWGLTLCTNALPFALTCFLILRLLQDKSVAVVLWSLPLAGFLLRLSLGKQVEKALGVQLETLYASGRTIRRFVPIGKILRPVLNECVTPVTCYWTLSLIIAGEEQLLLVFKELNPPVSMLVPIWKALCAATANEE